MKYEQLLLPSTASNQSIDAVIHALGQMAGVQAASRTPDSCTVTVGFDEKLTSVAAIRAGLEQAGHALAQPKATSGCCGACGG